PLVSERRLSHRGHTLGATQSVFSDTGRVAYFPGYHYTPLKGEREKKEEGIANTSLRLPADESRRCDHSAHCWRARARTRRCRPRDRFFRSRAGPYFSFDSVMKHSPSWAREISENPTGSNLNESVWLGPALRSLLPLPAAKKEVFVSLPVRM